MNPPLPKNVCISGNARHDTVLMLLSNAYDPDPRVRQEALALIGMGCRVHLIAWDRDMKAAPSECVEGVDVERVFVRSAHGRGTAQIFFYAMVYWKMLWRGLQTPFDVVHCHDLDTLPVGFLLGKLRRKRVIYDAHESFPDMLQGNVPRIVSRALVLIENFFIRRIDLLITVGERLRRHFAERGACHSVVVGNWKRAEDFVRTGRQNLEVRSRLGIPNDALTVVCITQLLKDRKLAELLEAAQRFPDVYVILAGKGLLEPMIREAAAANPRISFVGFVSGRQIADYTCVADIVYYGFDPRNPNARFSVPNKLHEALAAGRPLITGDFGEIGEVVRVGRCGFVLPEYSADEIGKALAAAHDRGLWRQMASNASQLGRTSLNWQKGEETLSREYSKLLRHAMTVPPGSRDPQSAAAAGVRG
jgi:glycosyltransferase involved in cell wall biosynthesis